ncbi:uncharacterized protein BJX67DRAFT_380744 [Aspergillus lucknowensis]|uniref:Uncharacterized protein n=1 Tax=Aspergillus lucknowensis TaxID=176173 RepID=A0ABR4LTJ2_9EURO
MSRLSGSVPPQADLHSVLERIRARPASRLTFVPRRASIRSIPDPPVRSFSSSLTRRDHVRSLPEVEPPRLGSRLRTRYVPPPAPPTAPETPAARPGRRSFCLDTVPGAPTARPSFRRYSIVAARQANASRPAPSERPALPSRLHLPARTSGTTLATSNRPSFRSSTARWERPARSAPRWTDKPVKHVHFEPTVEVIPVTPWINNPVRHVHFDPEPEVVTVSRWIKPRLHMHRSAWVRPSAQATHARSRESPSHTPARSLDPLEHVSRLLARAREARLAGGPVTPSSQPCDHGQSRPPLRYMPERAPNVVLQSRLHKRESTRHMGYLRSYT